MATSKLSFKPAAFGGVSLLALLSSIAILQFDCPEEPPRPSPSCTEQDNRPTYMLHGDQLGSGYLKHVEIVLRRLGLRRVTNSTSFDLLWSHPYPFGEHAPFSKNFLLNLTPYQKVNHFPGTGFYTNKVDLAVSNSKYIPKAFHLPKQRNEALEYAAKYPKKMFVQKSNSHRGIKIVKVGDMNLNQSGTFVQEYVPNPLLVDGHKFDIGIYTVLTSVDPLRVYVYDGDALLRFCPKKYEPFDSEDPDKYVVADDYIPTWDMPSLKKLYQDHKLTMKDSLNTYLTLKGKNPEKIWNNIQDAISKVFLVKEDAIIGIANRYKNLNNFFEMVRFDFIVDTDLNVFLMEANMSPNLSSAHFPSNRLLYESVLYSLFSLVGVGRLIRAPNLAYRSLEEAEMAVSERHLAVFAERCLEKRCEGCAAAQCRLCRQCLTPRSLTILRTAYQEHVHRVNCRRIFPPSWDRPVRVEEVHLDQYSPENQLLVEWFLGKCKQDTSWC